MALLCVLGFSVAVIMLWLQRRQERSPQKRVQLPGLFPTVIVCTLSSLKHILQRLRENVKHKFKLHSKNFIYAQGVKSHLKEKVCFNTSKCMLSLGSTHNTIPLLYDC